MASRMMQLQFSSELASSKLEQQRSALHDRMTGSVQRSLTALVYIAAQCCIVIGGRLRMIRLAVQLTVEPLRLTRLPPLVRFAACPWNQRRV